MLTQLEIQQLIEAFGPLLNPRQPPYLIGEQLSITETNTVVNTAGLVFTLQANANRVGLFVAISAGAQIAMTTALRSNNNNGLVFNPTNPNVFLNINDHGVLPQMQWYFYSSAITAGGLCVIELLWKPTS